MGKINRQVGKMKLFEDYLEEYPEDRVVKTHICYDE